jgi:hypothetical protein
MFCLGIDPPPFLALLSDLFHRIYPVAILVTIAGFAVALTFWKHNWLVVGVNVVALIMLLEPTVFLSCMLLPLVFDFNSESWAAFATFKLLVLTPICLPVFSLWLQRHRLTRA